MGKKNPEDDPRNKHTFITFITTIIFITFIPTIISHMYYR